VVLNRARQPNFSSQGQLLVNNEESSQGENIGLLDSNFTWLGLVSDAPEDRHPFWSQDSSTYVFSNPNMLLDPLTQERLPFLFIPCSLRRPVEEQEQKCRDTAGQSKLTSGSYPVWTDDNRVAFYGTAGEDGLYLISAWATARGSGGSTDPQLIMPVSDGRPSDTHGNRLYFSASTLHGNWEAYAVNLDGSNLINLSNGPDSQDGLPTVSPDGQWVAFVSNRAGPWGIWLVPSSGGTPELLLDLSTINTNPSPWGAGDHDWTNERITWGP
jgi:Tol biopolymer transport system component